VRKTVLLSITLATTMVSVLAEPLQAADPACQWSRTRIVGGTDARLRNWPGQAAFRLHAPAGRVSMYFCGGTAISKRWVVTAAHCLHAHAANVVPALRNSRDEVHDGRLEVVLGTGNLDQVAPENVYQVERYVIHPAYQQEIDKVAGSGDPDWVRGQLGFIPQSVGNDIALVRLDRDWDGPVARLSLGPDFDPSTIRPVRVAGFGRTDNDQEDIYGKRHRSRDGLREFYAFSPRLLETAVETRPNEVCRQQYPGTKIGAEQICAGLDEGGRDSCGGDSGGPLIVRDKQGCPRQVGVVSWGGEMCADSRAFGVYTRLSAYADWMRDATGLPLGDAVTLAMPDANLLTEAESDEAVRQLRDLFGPASGRVEVAIEDRRGRAAGIRIRLGDSFLFRVKSSISGRLVIIDIDATGKVTLIYPNRYVREDDLGFINAAESVRIPGPGYPGFTHFQAVEPIGKSRLLVLVVPRDFNIERNAAPTRVLTRGFAPRNEPASYLMRLVRQIEVALRLRGRDAGAGEAVERYWAFEAYDYEIVR
jgi:secreted trypsin-like serine protease